MQFSVKCCLFLCLTKLFDQSVTSYDQSKASQAYWVASLKHDVDQGLAFSCKHDHEQCARNFPLDTSKLHVQVQHRDIL